MVAFAGARPGVGATGVAVGVAALAARAGNRVLLLDAVEDGVLAQRLGARPDAAGSPLEVRPGLRLLRAPADAAHVHGRSADLVVLDTGAGPAGRQAVSAVADHVVLLTAPDPQAIERLIAEVDIGPRAEVAGPRLLGVVVVGLPAEPRQPFVEVRRLLRGRWGETLPVLDRPVRSAPFAAWVAQSHALPLHELLERPDVVPAGHPRRSEIAGLAADHRHLGQALIEAITRAEDHPAEGWAMRWNPPLRSSSRSA